MSSTYIPQALPQQVAEQARYRCGYCLTSEAVVGTPMEIDPIIPESLGGPTEEENLWLACSLCNDHKSNRIAALDSLTGEIVRLFDHAAKSGSQSAGIRQPTSDMMRANTKNQALKEHIFSLSSRNQL